MAVSRNINQNCECASSSRQKIATNSAASTIRLSSRSRKGSEEMKRSGFIFQEIIGVWVAK